MRIWGERPGRWKKQLVALRDDARGRKGFIEYECGRPQIPCVIEGVDGCPAVAVSGRASNGVSGSGSGSAKSESLKLIVLKPLIENKCET